MTACVFFLCQLRNRLFTQLQDTLHKNNAHFKYKPQRDNEFAEIQ